MPPLGAYAAKRCPVVTQNDILQPGEQVATSEFSQHLFDMGDDFEREMFEALAERGALWIEADDEEERIALTVRAMDDRVPVILDGRLPDDQTFKRAGRPDVLIAAEAGGYRPADIKSHRLLQSSRSRFPARVSTLDAPGFGSAVVQDGRYIKKHEKDLLQLAHYQRMLENLGQAATDGRFAAILTPEELFLWLDLDEPTFTHTSRGGLRNSRSTMERYDFEFAFRLDIAARAVRARNGEDVELVPPVRIPECDRCPWHDVCLEALSEQDGDISLLPKIGYAEWREHTNRGVRDRAQLAALRADDPRYADWPLHDLQEHIDSARAWMGPDPFYLRPGVDRFDVPRADIEIDIDLENYAGRTYLWGALLTEDDTSEFHAFATWDHLDHDAEVQNVRRFWHWLSEQLQRAESEGRSVRVYHFADIERSTLRRLGADAGLLEPIDRMLEAGVFVDMLRSMREQLITGTALGLKVVAPLAGFSWEVDDAGGAISMLRYEEAVGEGSEEAKQWLLRYNEGDVRATLAIRDHLTAHPPSSLPDRN